MSEKDYLNLMGNILKGNIRTDRTGTGTYSLFGTQLKFSLENNVIPLLTTKKMFIKGIIEELLFFIRGETNTKKLEEKGVNIWKGNSSKEFIEKRGLNLFEGEIGPMYGYLWRNFNGEDQLKNALNLIKNDPSSRRIIVTAYDPSLSCKCVLDPCHLFFQFYVNGKDLSCQFMMRSADYFLGVPFNICSYAVLTHLFAKAANLNAKELIFIGGDTHIYSNHVNAVQEQIIREPYNFPKLYVNKHIQSIEDMEKLEFEDFEIRDYKHYAAIKVKMAV